MSQVQEVVRCYSCQTFQAHIQKKVKKWVCKICQEKQSVRKVYFMGLGAACRKVVMEFNMKRGEIQETQGDILLSSMEPTGSERSQSTMDESERSQSTMDESERSQGQSSTGEPRARNAENGTGSRWSAFLEPVDGSEKLTPDPELWAREYDTEDNFIGSFHPRQRNQNQSHKTTKKIHRGGGLGEADGGSEEADDHNTGWQEYERNEEKIISRLFEDDNTKLECSSSKSKRAKWSEFEKPAHLPVVSENTCRSPQNPALSPQNRSSNQPCKTSKASKWNQFQSDLNEIGPTRKSPERKSFTNSKNSSFSEAYVSSKLNQFESKTKKDSPNSNSISSSKALCVSKTSSKWNLFKSFTNNKSGKKSTENPQNVLKPVNWSSAPRSRTGSTSISVSPSPPVLTTDFTKKFLFKRN